MNYIRSWFTRLFVADLLTILKFFDKIEVQLSKLLEAEIAKQNDIINQRLALDVAQAASQEIVARAAGARNKIRDILN